MAMTASLLYTSFARPGRAVISHHPAFWESKLENFLMGILIFNSDYFWNENPAARGEDIAFLKVAPIKFVSTSPSLV
jgi:hypothetical protein